MSNMMIHCGGEIASLDQIQEVPLPPETKSYVPVAHGDLVLNIHKVAGDMLADMELTSATFALAAGKPAGKGEPRREGARFFGLSTFMPKEQTDDEQEMGLSIGYRNSYDKSMTIGMAIGARVFVCDNLALSGDMTVAHVHTGDVIDRMRKDIITCLYGARDTWTDVQETATKLADVEITDDDGFRFLGSLIGEKVLRPTQFNEACREWRQPTHEVFEPRTAWSIYNAVTESLKTTPVRSVIQNHLDLHEAAVGEFLPTAN
jgi:hypothetical protein